MWCQENSAAAREGKPHGICQPSLPTTRKPPTPTKFLVRKPIFFCFHILKSISEHAGFPACSRSGSILLLPPDRARPGRSDARSFGGTLSFQNQQPIVSCCA